MCRWPGGIKTGRHLGMLGQSAVARVGDLWVLRGWMET